MPIRVGHGPITAAAGLAQMAGRGDDFWRRFSAEQQMMAGMRQDRAQALKTRQVMGQEEEGQRRFDISTALQYDKLAQQDRAAREQAERLSSQNAALEAYRRQTASNQASQEARLSRSAERTEAADVSFRERFGMGQSELSAQQAQSRIDMSQRALKARTDNFLGSESGKAMQAQVKALKSELAQYDKDIDNLTDPISKKIGQLRGRPGVEAVYDAVKRRRDETHERYVEANSRLKQGLDSVIGGGVQASPQGGRAPQAPTPQDIDRLAKGVGLGIPATARPDMVLDMVEAKLALFGVTDPQVIWLVAQAVLEGRR